jgi:hypothetical protein
MLKDVLGITRSKFQPADIFYKLSTDAMHTQVECSLVSSFLYRQLNFLIHFFDNIFYPCRVNTPVLDQSEK